MWRLCLFKMLAAADSFPQPQLLARREMVMSLRTGVKEKRAPSVDVECLPVEVSWRLNLNPHHFLVRLEDPAGLELSLARCFAPSSGAESDETSGFIEIADTETRRTGCSDARLGPVPGSRTLSPLSHTSAGPNKL